MRRSTAGQALTADGSPASRTEPSGRGGAVTGRSRLAGLGLWRAGRSSLFRKYLAALLGLVSVVLLVGGGVQSYFSYQESRDALIEIQRGQARAVVTQIQQFVNAIFIPAQVTNDSTRALYFKDSQPRREEYRRLLRQVPSIMDVRYLDENGREHVLASSSELDRLESGDDFSHDPAYLQARQHGSYFGPLSLRDGTLPSMRIGLAEGGYPNGFMLADVDLSGLWVVIAQARLGRSGTAYIVDADGRLVAHPDRTLVQQGVDVSRLPQVRAALAQTSQPDGAPQASADGRDPSGRAVLYTRAAVSPPGWWVFVEQPKTEIYAPLYNALLRNAALLLAGLALAFAVSVLLARRMVTPVRRLQSGVARIGAGQLDQPVAVDTGDELEALAADFNRMSGRLQESYAELEQKVTERTRDLSVALERVDQQREQLETANRHKSEFLTHMSHELRTPLNAVLGFSQLLLTRMFGDLNEKQDEYLHDVVEAGQHLLSLINDVLDLSKIEAGSMQFSPEPVSLPDVLRSSLTIVRERASRQGVGIELQVDKAIGIVEADQRKLRQALYNLLSNAVKFTPAGGRVEVAARLLGDDVRIDVCDTGTGIEQEDLERIFDAFQQAGSAATEGTGLGLTLTKELVELHGGRISVESVPGQGSIFTIVMPVRRGAAVGAAFMAAGSDCDGG